MDLGFKDYFKQAFTLIELLVVIAIIGILSGLIIVGMSSTTQSANIAKGQIFSSSLRDSLLASIVSEWKFDQINVPSANLTPDSWASNNCTLSGTTVPTLQSSRCVYGNCLSFNGSTAYLDCGNNSSLNLTQATTVSFWVNPLNYSFSVAAFICGNGLSSLHGYHVWLWQTGYVEYRSCQSGANQGTTSLTGFIPQNSWTNVVITRSGSTATIYINGTDRTNTHATHIDPVSSLSNTFMGRYIGGGYFLNGWLDEIRIFNAVMPISKIKEEYYAGIGRLLAGGGISKEYYDVGLTSLVIGVEKKDKTVYTLKR